MATRKRFGGLATMGAALAEYKKRQKKRKKENEGGTQAVLNIIKRRNKALEETK